MTAAIAAALAAGRPYPFGCYYDGKGVNFAIYSADAQRVELCLFDEQGSEQRLPLPCRSGDVWHGYLPGGLPGQRYGYRLYGQWEPSRGLRFNPQKLTIDPYSRALDSKVPDAPSLYDREPPPNSQDNAQFVPKASSCTNPTTGRTTVALACYGVTPLSTKLTFAA